MRCKQRMRARAELARLYSNRCAECRNAFPLTDLTLDHILPQVLGGSDDLDNLQLMCGPCNWDKSDAVWWEDPAFLSRLELV